LTEYVADLRDRYNIKGRTKVKIIPKAEGILIKPQAADPVAELRGLAKGLWPDEVSSVELIRKLRRRADLEAKERL